MVHVALVILPISLSLLLYYLFQAPAIMSSTTTQTQVITAENILRLFPEINTSLAHAAASSELDGYDEEQVRLMEEVCIVLDEDDIPIGSASKKICTHSELNSVAEKN